MNDLPKRFSVDPKANKHDQCTVELPFHAKAVKTMVAMVMTQDGRIHFAGPLVDLPLTKRLLAAGLKLVNNYEQSQIIVPAQQLPPGLRDVSKN